MTRLSWLQERTENGEFRGTFERKFAEALSVECFELGAILNRRVAAGQFNYTWTTGDRAFDVFFSHGKHIGDRSEVVYTEYDVEHNTTSLSVQNVLDFARAQSADSGMLETLQRQVRDAIQP